MTLAAAACAPNPTPGPSNRIKVTASSATIAYGDAVPEVTATYSSPTTIPATCTTTATASSPPGVYPTTCSGAGEQGKIIEYVDGAITVTKAPVTVTASSAAITVGDAIPAITATYDGLKFGATAPATEATCGTDATSNDAGIFATTCSGAVDDNYSFTYVDGTIEVAPATVIVTASSATTAYGQPAPVISASYAGFVNGETEPGTPPTCSSAVIPASPVGQYASTCSGAVDPNYSFTYVDGTVDVTPAPLTITASSASFVSGQAVPAITPSYSGLVNGETATDTAPICSTTATSSSAAGDYPSNCSGAADPNYLISYVPGVVTVTAGTSPVVVTAPSVTITYGDAVPALVASYSGLVGGNQPDTPATCSTLATSGSPAGTYPIECSGATDPAYTFSYVAGTLTITPAAATVTASSESMEYGGTVPAVSAGYGGLLAGDSAPATPPTCATTATSNSNVGSYAATCSGAADPNYTFSYVPGTVTVTRAQATVTASSTSFEQGAAVPAITPSYSGFLFGQTAPATAPLCSTNATSSSPVGTYSSTCSGADDPNYTFSAVDGVVTVTAPSTPTPTVTGYGGYSTITHATTISPASNGASLPQTTINVDSVSGFSNYTNLTVVTSAGAQAVFCKTADSANNRFSGCSGGAGAMATGGFVSDGAVNTFDVYTLVGGAGAVEPSSVTILQDIPAAFRGMPAQLNAGASFGLVTSAISPAATGSFNLVFGICDAGTPTYSANNPNCTTGEIVYGAGAISNMGAEVKISGPFGITVTSNVYQKLHTAVTAPQTVSQGDTFTVFAAAAGAAIPKLNPSSVGDATVNSAEKVSIVFPIPAGMEFVSAATMGGDARTSGQLQFNYCTASGTPGCSAKLTGNYDWTTLPYIQVSLPDTFSVPGGSTMTVPTVAMTMKAVGAVGTTANATLTQFNLTTKVNAPIVGNKTVVFSGYPTSGSSDVTPPKAPPAVLGTIEIVN